MIISLKTLITHLAGQLIQTVNHPLKSVVRSSPDTRPKGAALPYAPSLRSARRPLGGPDMVEGWFKLPLKLRQRWWRETDYGRQPPSPELLAAIAQARRGD